MKNIEVKKIVQAIETSDGAGVKLKRSIGTPEADYIDPFLMLDEFGSENKDDYIAGFPPHPHRGIETVTYMLKGEFEHQDSTCLLYTSPSPRDPKTSRMPSSA